MIRQVNKFVSEEMKVARLSFYQCEMIHVSLCSQLRNPIAVVGTFGQSAAAAGSVVPRLH